MMIKNLVPEIRFHIHLFVIMKIRMSIFSPSLVFILNFFFSYLGDVQLSLCGNLDKQSMITDEMFYAYLVPYETFANNPTIIHDPNLVARIGGKYVINQKSISINCLF